MGLHKDFQIHFYLCGWKRGERKEKIKFTSAKLFLCHPLTSEYIWVEVNWLVQLATENTGRYYRHAKPMTNTKNQHWSLPPFKVKLWVKTLLFLVLHQLLAHTGLAALLCMYQVTVYAKTNTHTHTFLWAGWCSELVLWLQFHLWPLDAASKKT